MAAIGLVLLMLVGVMPITVKAAAPAVSGSVWVGGEELKNIGDFVKSSDGNGGQATLYATSIGPALVLDNYVYEGDGYEYDTGCYAGIYYAANNPLYIILGTDINGIASENSITITAENATESYGIFINTNYTNNLFIDGSMNNAADALTVIGGVATTLLARKEAPTPKSYVDRSISAVWAVFGVSSLYAFVAAVVYSTSMFFLIVLLMGMGTVITGAICRHRNLTICGGVAMLLSLIFPIKHIVIKNLETEALHSTTDWLIYSDIIIFAVIFLVMMVIPGHIMHKRSSNN